jgi:hypothetical protein
MVNVFKWRHFQSVIILQCVRWYLKYGISYRDLEEMMKERGVEVGPYNDLSMGHEVCTRAQKTIQLVR